MTSPSAAPAGLLDVHGHFLTDAYVAAAHDHGVTRPDGMPGWPQWDSARHLRLMDRLGIARTLLSISSPGVAFAGADATELARDVNDAATELCATRPERFGFLATLPLSDVQAATREWERVRTAPGIAGAILLSHSDGVRPGDPRLEPLWATLAADRAVVLVHPTSPPGHEFEPDDLPRPAAEFMFETVRAALSLAHSGIPLRHPGVRIVLPHGGGALTSVADRIALFRQADDRVPDLDAAIDRLWFDVAGAALPLQVPPLVARAGTERLVYGSDFCFTPAIGVGLLLGALDAAEGPDERSWRDVLAGNGERLLDASIAPPASGGRLDRGAVARRLFARIAERTLL